MPFALPATRRVLTLIGGTAVAAALVTGLASCGSAGSQTAAPVAASTPLAGLAPDQAVKTAFENLGRATTVHTRLRLDTSPGAAASMTKGSGAMTPAQAGLLRDGTLDLTVTAPQGESVGQALAHAQGSQGKSAASFELALNGSQGPLAGIRSVDGSLYAMANLPQLSQVAGTDLTQKAKGLGAQDAALAPIMSALTAGKWLEVSADALRTYGGLLGQGSGMSGLGTDIPGDLESAFSKNVTWKPGATIGTYDGTLQARSFVEDVYPDFAGLGQLGGSPLPSKDQLLATMPTTVTAEVATANDQVSSVTLDALQFDHNGADLEDLGPNPKVDLVASFDTTSAPVAAPAGAVVLDRQIPSILMGLGGLSGASA